MSLRFKLLLVALSTLVLPWSGWQFVRLTETLLRQGQEQALLATANTLGKTLAVLKIELPVAGPALYIHTIDTAIVIDGYADDWYALKPYMQTTLGSVSDVQKLRVALASNEDGLYLLAEVRDATRARADARDMHAEQTDHLTVTLMRQGETRRYRLASAAPGSFEAPALDPGSLLPDRLNGHWQEDGSGYRVELRLPRVPLPESMSINVYDSALTQNETHESRSLLSYRADTAQQLAKLTPAQVRMRLVSADGWLIAQSGALDTSKTSTQQGWLEHWIYHGLIASALTGSHALDAMTPRLDASEVWQALSGVAATSWRTENYSDAIILAAVVPLQNADGIQGALIVEQSSETLPLLANRALFGLAGATLVALAVAGAILLIFGAALSLRIRRLRNAADCAVHRSGRFENPLPLIDAKDELGDLARSFNALLGEVGAYTDYLRTLAAKLSHELNTPLAIVKSSLDNLDLEGLPAAAQPYLVRARDGADRMGAIVRAMSEASRIEQAIAAAEAEDFDLRALVIGCTEGYRGLVGERKLQLSVPDAPVWLHGAPDLIAQALDKLFDNARSFTPEHGWIAVTLEQTTTNIMIRVANAGPSLPESMQEHLFDSLVSLREKSVKTLGGTPHLGLGLYVVRLVTELHQGTAKAANLSNGEGVEFVLTLAAMPRQRLSG